MNIELPDIQAKRVIDPAGRFFTLKGLRVRCAPDVIDQLSSDDWAKINSALLRLSWSTAFSVIVGREELVIGHELQLCARDEFDSRVIVQLEGC